MATKEQRQIDLDLMQRIATDDESAVGELYDRFGALVYRMAFQSMPSRAEAEDAVQEVFVRLWKTADRYNPERAALVTWVLLITRRHLVDRLRRAQARVKLTGMSEQVTPPAINPEAAAGMESSEQYQTLMKRVNQLPELQKTVIVRAYLGGQTLRQIADELETPIGTIKSALSRALVRLRERSGVEEAV
ncbi:MAG: sigma-70 family RNA polymerase sigma factor [Planctomycetota bacterium]